MCIGAGCAFNTSESYWSILKQVNAKADDLESAEAGCSDNGIGAALGKLRCTPGVQRLINLLRHPVFGPTVGAWLYGLSDKEMTYGPDAALVQGLQTTTHIEETRSRVREYLRDGSFTAEGLDAYYDAGGFTLEDGSFNRKVVTDGLALSFPELASNRAAATASLGSYHMQVFASDINPTTRTATVAFVGWNEMTLGSAMASAGGLREVANQYAPASGPLSAVRMDFGWTETIHY